MHKLLYTLLYETFGAKLFKIFLLLYKMVQELPRSWALWRLEGIVLWKDVHPSLMAALRDQIDYNTLKLYFIMLSSLQWNEMKKYIETENMI